MPAPDARTRGACLAAALLIALAAATRAQPQAGQPQTDQPQTDQPATDQPATDLPATDQPPTDQPPTVVLGVRTDAAPFAWQAAETGSFRGYLNDLCTEAATRAGYTFRQVPVTAEQREAVLAGNPAVPTPDGPAVLDVLCDPTTISLQRLRDLHGTAAGDAPTPAEPERLTFSPILFVANGAYVAGLDHPPRQLRTTAGAWAAPPGCTFLALGPPAESAPGGVQEVSIVTLAPDAPPAERDAFFGPAAATFQTAGYVRGTTSLANVRRHVRETAVPLCLLPQPSHPEGVAAICEGALDLYFGDLDIIDAYRRQFSERATAPCELEPGRAVLSYEPYALLMSSATPGFRPRFVAALYEIFSDGTAAGRFASYFPGYAKSTALDLLFRINSIPGLRDSDSAGTNPPDPPDPP